MDIRHPARYVQSVKRSRRHIDWSHALAVAEPPPKPVSDQEPKDFNVHVRVRNGRLLAAIRSLGHPSVAACARALGVSQSELSGYVTMRLSPFSAVDGLPTKRAKWLAERLFSTVEQLFPPRLMAAAMATASRPVDLNLSDEQIVDFLHQTPFTPEEYLQLSTAQARITQAVGTVSPREGAILTQRLGLDGGEEHTLRELSPKWGVTPERIRSIEAAAIRKLSHGSRRFLLNCARDDLGWWVLPEALVPPAIPATQKDHVPEPLPEHIPPKPPPKPKPPPPEVQRLTRRVRFPGAAQPRQAEGYRRLHVCSPDVIRLLSIPDASRTDPVKRALAFHLEHEFSSRGAGTLRVHTVVDGIELSPEQIALRKYDYLMANLVALWELFPPAPELEAGSAS